MRLLLSLLATVILVVPARWAAAAPVTQRDTAERIAEILEVQRSEQHIPGFAFALVRKDRLELVIDLYQEVRVESKAMVGTEGAFLMTLVPKARPNVLLSVSTPTGLILKRETEGESVVFSDYRLVNGVRIPFRSTISDALGETKVEVEQARVGSRSKTPLSRPPSEARGK